MEHLYMARQPIFHKDGTILAYELLYRDTSTNRAEVSDNLHATARVLVNAFNYIGLHTITHGNKAFIKVDEKVLTDDVVETMSPDDFVLEIVESAQISSDLVTRIEKLAQKGYRFALDHYRFDDEFIRKFHGLLTVVDYIKIDPRQALDAETDIAALAPFKLEFIAEKIEDEATFQQASQAGFSYFQGYHFSKPNLFEHENYDPDRNLLLDLISMLKSGTSLHGLVPKLNLSPFLLINLLKLIQQEQESRHSLIDSTEEAIIAVGRDRLQHWLELLYYAGEERPESGVESHARHVTRHGVQRAVFMEELSRSLNKSSHFQRMAYFTGMLSIYEDIYQKETDNLLQEVHLNTQIVNALSGYKGELGYLLKLIIATEQNNTHTMDNCIVSLNMASDEFNRCLIESYKKSTDLF